MTNKTITASLTGAFSAFLLYQFVVVLLSKGVL